MANQDWENFGEEIRRTVQNAVDSQDFEKLNQTISNSINRAVNSAAQGLKSVGDMVDHTKQAGNQARQQYERKKKNTTGPVDFKKAYADHPTVSRIPKAPYYAKTTGKKVAASLVTIIGYSLGMIFLLGFLGTLFGFTVVSSFDIPFLIALAILSIFVVGFGIAASIGSSTLNRIRRFRTYIQVLHGRDYCDIKELSLSINKSNKYVVKDIESMIAKGWFRQGHLDQKKTCLMVSHAAYDQYLELMKQTEAQKRQEEQVRSQKADSSLPPEVQEVIRTGDEFIRKIRQSNDAIPGQEISAKISHMEMLVDKIFDRVEQNPESVTEIRRLMEYYLPTTVKLLKAYEDLDGQPVQGENIITAKREIEKTLDTLNIAFEKLLDSLFKETAWDVASDVSVLNTLLAQEGLTEDGLTGSRGKVI